MSLMHFICAATLAFVFAAVAVGQEQFELPNPSFEEDYENNSIPDGWSYHRDTVVTVERERVSHGVKAAKFTDGYVLASHQQDNLKNLAGKKMVISFDAAGDDGSQLGAMVGYLHKQADGKDKFVHHRLTWGKKLTEAYQRVVLPVKFAADAADGRVWLGVYRSNKQGVVYLDNFQLVHGGVTEEQQAALRRMYREWQYVLDHADAVESQVADKAALQALRKQAQHIAGQAASQNPAVLDEAPLDGPALREARARLLQLSAGDQPWLASWSNPLTRLTPMAAVPASLETQATQVALAGSYEAMAVTLWNASDADTTVSIAIAGLDAAADEIEVRRQVFMENWYDKERTRMTDPMTLLDRQGDGWALPMEQGEVVKLYVGYKTKADAAGQFPVNVTLASDAGQTQTLAATLEVAGVGLPAQPRLEHWQCVYMDLLPAARHPELAAKDLASHYVTSVQFPYAPPATYSADGQLLSHDFASTTQARWMRAYAKHIDKLWIFWEGSFVNRKLRDQAGNVIEPIDEDGNWTPAVKTAMGQTLRAWLDFAASEGFGLEHWAILPDDEPRSGMDWKRAPGPEIGRAVEAYKLTRAAEPGLEIQVTLTDYALPEDVEAMLPHVDVVLPVFPYRDHLVQWAPPKYNPEATFNKTIAPMLRKYQRDGLKVWSYKVSRGIKDDPLSEELMYPVQAVAQGFTGIGYWAYNVTRGQSWDDRDGGLLNYSFVYNGEETHPLNRKYNVTGEIIVPSIRWELLRIGQQHGQMLLYLKDQLDKDNASASQKQAIEALLATAATFSPRPGQRGAQASYETFVRELKNVYINFETSK